MKDLSLEDFFELQGAPWSQRKKSFEVSRLQENEKVLGNVSGSLFQHLHMCLIDIDTFIKTNTRGLLK